VGGQRGAPVFVRRAPHRRRSSHWRPDSPGRILTNFVNRGEKLGAMPDDDYNLRRAEEHVAEARRLVLRQKGLITRLRAAGIDTSNAEPILKVLERNLKTFEEYRDALKRRHADVGPSAADEADSVGSG
jgi:hypothetical protein